MKSKPVILVIENSIDVTGALKSITRTAFDLRSFFDFEFIIPKNSKGRFWIEDKGFNKIRELPLRELSRRFSSLVLYIPFLLANAIRLNRMVKQKGISIVHVNDLYNLLPVVIRLLGNSTPYICHIRFLPDRFPAWLFNFWLRLHFRYASKVVAVSQSVLNMLPTHSKLMYIHEELPPREQFPELTESGNQKSSFTFLYLSNFIKGKGQNYALEAYSKIHEELPDWKLRFVGGDMGLKKNREYRMELQERAKELGFFEKIEWLGFTEVVELEYKKADVVLNFSESESFSMTCLEALYFGRPVIATDCGGPSEIIDDEQTGILVPNRNIDAMAEAMKRIATNERMRRKMSLTAREVVRNRFSVEKTSFKWRGIYENVLIQSK
jgi:L-malate glycosyltransferase